MVIIAVSVEGNHLRRETLPLEISFRGKLEALRDFRNNCLLKTLKNLFDENIKI